MPVDTYSLLAGDSPHPPHRATHISPPPPANERKLDNCQGHVGPPGATSRGDVPRSRRSPPPWAMRVLLDGAKRGGVVLEKEASNIGVFIASCTAEAPGTRGRGSGRASWGGTKGGFLRWGGGGVAGGLESGLKSFQNDTPEEMGTGTRARSLGAALAPRTLPAFRLPVPEDYGNSGVRETAGPGFRA